MIINKQIRKWVSNRQDRMPAEIFQLGKRGEMTAAAKQMDTARGTTPTAGNGTVELKEFLET